MSNAKHSGLLARDEARRPSEEEEEEEELGNVLSLHLSTPSPNREGEGEKPQQITGREIFTIQTARRSAAKKPSIKQTKMSGEPTGADAEGESRGENEVSCEEKEVDAEELQPSGRGGKGKRVVERGRDKGRGRRRGRARNVQLRSDSEQENEDEFSDGEEDLDEEMEAVAAQLNRGSTAEEALEDYFTAHAGKAGPTSDHTLSRLAQPRLEQAAIETALQDVPSVFREDCQRLLEEYTELYPYWLLQMRSGFNILLYGLGSKKKLMEDFCKKCLAKSCHLVVNGYFPGLTLKQVLSSLSSDLLGHNGSFKSHTEHAQFITDALKRQSGGRKSTVPPEVFLLIHNLDGPMLRSERTQAALSVLASSSCVHVVASVDHINCGLLWDQTKLGRFNWAWHDVTTFQTYREETSYENSLVQQSGSLALSSLTHVMNSLTPNARGIFELLARYQLEEGSRAEKTHQGLSFSECYRRCRESFLVNSDLTLRAQLTEFRDHKLVRSTKGSDGVEYLTIPIDDATLTQFLSEFNGC